MSLVLSAVVNRIPLIVTNNDDMYKSLDEFEIRPDPTMDYRAYCPCTSGLTSTALLRAVCFGSVTKWF